MDPSLQKLYNRVIDGAQTRPEQTQENYPNMVRRIRGKTEKERVLASIGIAIMGGWGKVTWRQYFETWLAEIINPGEGEQMEPDTQPGVDVNAALLSILANQQKQAQELDALKAEKAATPKRATAKPKPKAKSKKKG